MKRFVSLTILSFAVLCLTAAVQIRHMVVSCGDGTAYLVDANRDLTLAEWDIIADYVIDNYCD